MNDITKTPRALEWKTTHCPKCKGELHFLVYGTFRIVENGCFLANCPNCKWNYQVKK